MTCLHMSGFGKSGTTQSGIHIEFEECDDICTLFDHNIAIVGITVAFDCISNGENILSSSFRRTSLPPDTLG